MSRDRWLEDQSRSVAPSSGFPAAAGLVTTAAWRPLVTRGALLLMESFWVYAFTAFVVAAIAEPGKPTPLGAAVVVFASFGISRFLQQRTDLNLGLLRVWGVILSFIIFYAVIRIDFFDDWRLWDFSFADRLFNHTEATMRERVDAVFGVPVLWAFWMRGVARGQQHTGFEEVVGSFGVGIVVITFVELFQRGAGAPREVALVAVPYIATGLLAIALSHAARSDDQFARSFAPTWLISVGGAVLLLSVIALGFILVDYSAAAALLADAAKAAGWVLARVAYYVTWPFVWLIERMMEAARWLFENVWSGQRQERQQFEPEEEQQRDPQESQPLPAWARLLLRVLTGGASIALLIAATALLFRRFYRRGGPQEVKESTYQEGRLASDIGGFLGSLIGRLRPNLHFGDRLDPARRLYFDMLNAAAHRGVERRSSETPLELAPRLEATFSPGPPSRITGLFDDVRYGSLSPPSEEVRRLRQEWEAARDEARR